MAEDAPLDELVRWQVDDRGLARLTLARPEAKNALTWQMRDRVSELMEAASVDVGIRAVVIEGEGGAFCAGADLRTPQPPPPRPDDAPARVAGVIATLVARGWQRLAVSILDCAKLVVAVVDGTAGLRTDARHRRHQVPGQPRLRVGPVDGPARRSRGPGGRPVHSGRA